MESGNNLTGVTYTLSQLKTLLMILQQICIEMKLRRLCLSKDDVGFLGKSRLADIYVGFGFNCFSSKYMYMYSVSVII